MSVNKVTLLGNVCQDPRITTFQDGGKVAQFTIATNERGYTKEDGTQVEDRAEFHNVVVNRNALANVVEQYVKKGNRLYIEGKLRTRKYTDKNNVERYVTEVYVNELEMLTPKDSQGVPAPTPEDDNRPF